MPPQNWQAVRAYRLRLRLDRLKGKSAPFPEASFWKRQLNKIMAQNTVFISRPQYNRMVDGNLPGQYNSYVTSQGWGKVYPIQTVKLTTPDGQFVGAAELIAVPRAKFLPFSKVPATLLYKADRLFYEENKLPLE